MQLLENQMVLNIPDASDDFGVCDTCGSTQNYSLFFKDGEMIGCQDCLPQVKAWYGAICPVCRSEDCRILYLRDGGGYYGCDECVTEADSNSLEFIEYEKR